MDDKTWVYTVGALILANLGTIGAVLYAAAKGVWWMAKLESKVEENTKDINAAHSKIRDIDLMLKHERSN